MNVIYVQVERCTGCGVCIQVCPTGAITLQRGVAIIDQAECTQCETCLEACPEGAILSVSEPVAEPAVPPAERPMPEVIRVQVPPAPALSAMPPTPWRARVLPVVAAALAYAGRELPRLLPVMLEALERRRSPDGSSGLGAAKGGRGSSGRQH